MAKIESVINIPAIQQEVQQLATMVGQMKTAFTELAGSLPVAFNAKNPADFQRRITELNAEVQRLKASEKDLNAANDQLKNSTVTLQEAVFKEAVAKQKAKLATTQLNKEAKEAAILASSEASAYDKLQVKLTQATREVQKMTLAHGANSRETKQAVAYQKALDKQIKELDATTGKHQRNVGNYTSAFANMGRQLLAVTGITAGLAGGVKLLQGIFKSTNEIADRFEITMTAAGQAGDFLMRSIAQMDFRNLIQGFRDAYTEGKRYATQLDYIADVSRAAGIQKEDIDLQIIRLRAQAKLNSTDAKQRAEIVDQIIELEKKKMNISKKVADETLQNELTNAAKISGARAGVIKSFVTNYEDYTNAIKEGQKLQERLNEIQPRYVTSLNDQGRAVATLVGSQVEYDKFQKSLTKYQLATIDLAKAEAIITDDKRDKIAGALKEQIAAERELADGEERLVRLRNRLNKELAEGEEANTAAIKTTTAAIDDKSKAIEAEGQKWKQAQIDNMLERILQTTEQIVDETTAFEDVPLKWKDDLAEALGEFEKLTAAIQEAQEATFKTLEDSAKQILSDQVSGYFDDQIGEMEARLDDWHKKQLDQLEERKNKGLISDAEYSKGREKIEAEYEAKRKAARIKEAQLKKQEALFLIAIDTAVAIAKAAPNPILMALAGAAGAAQAAVVVATPIPQYAKGRRGGPGEFAVVGELGTEAIRTMTGDVYLTPPTPTVTYLPRGADVIPSGELRQAMQRGTMDMTGDLRRLEDTFSREISELKQAIVNKREVSISLTERGLQTVVRNGNQYQEYLKKQVLL